MRRCDRYRLRRPSTTDKGQQKLAPGLALSSVTAVFARQGAVIEGLDINAEDAQTTINAIQAEGGQAFSPLVM